MQLDYRPLKSEDAKALSLLANNKKIASQLKDVFPHPYSEEDASNFIKFSQQFEPARIFGIIYNNQLVGAIGIHGLDDIYRKNGEIGYWLGEEYWGKGIISQAVNWMVAYGFENFDIVRIFAGVFETNHASQRVLEKCGFSRDAIIKKNIYKDGKFLSEHIFSIRKNSI